MQATGTLRHAGASKVVFWLIALIAGMLLAGAGGYLAHGSSTSAGTPSHAQSTSAPAGEPSANGPQFDGGLQR